MSSQTLVSLRYSDLVADIDLSDQIEQAYGPAGLGALTISGIPGYAEARDAFVPLTHSVAHLSDAVKATLEHSPSMWNVGWSHGKEKLGNAPDFAKGSYYCNPVFDVPEPDEAKIAEYPFFFPKNIWPDEALPQFEPRFKKLGQIMFDAVVLLCKQIDRYVAKNIPSYSSNFLFDHISKTRKIKGRGLYYFPLNEKNGENAVDDRWIGWHNDSGFLTALARDMFFDDASGKRIPNPDPKGGLWIIDRQSGAVKVDFPENEMAVQCGECLQIITGGLVVATPHCVAPSFPTDGTKIGRGSFPVFIDTCPDFPLSPPFGVNRAAVFDKTPNSKVPPLEQRWLSDGVPFVQYLGDSFRKYYEFALSQT